MVDSSVTRATTVQATVSVVAPSVAAGMASDRALPAKVKPIIMATGPVMEAGRMVSTAFLPKKLHQQAGGNGDEAGEDDAELGVLDGLCGEDTSLPSQMPSAAHMLAMAVR